LKLFKSAYKLDQVDALVIDICEEQSYVTEECIANILDMFLNLLSPILKMIMKLDSGHCSQMIVYYAQYIDYLQASRHTMYFDTEFVISETYHINISLARSIGYAISQGCL
jgi:hypothetical protein